MLRESLGNLSPGIGEGSSQQAGISPGAESQRLGPTAGAGGKGLVGYVRNWITALGSLSMLVSVLNTSGQMDTTFTTAE